MIELFESARLLSIAWGFAAQFLKLDDPVTLWYLTIGLSLIFILYRRQSKLKERIIELEKSSVQLTGQLQLIDQREIFQSTYLDEQERRFTWLTSHVFK